MSQLDSFTLNVLCNAEVIDVNQDLFGKQARIVRKTKDELILAKRLEDGSVAVGLFNLAPESLETAAALNDRGPGPLLRPRRLAADGGRAGRGRASPDRRGTRGRWRGCGHASSGVFVRR